MNDIKIDFVLPWVDPSDREWQKEKTFYSGNTSSRDENSEARFRDLNTLKYVLRSIEKNCPWYNRIFLITEGHSPEWLDLSSSKVVLVSHKELYFNREDLPVFNSSSIEMNLANILGLSDHFVYLNDDTLIFNRLDKSRFFRDGKPVDFLSHGWLKRGRLFERLRGRDTWVHSINNNIRLLQAKVNKKQISDISLFQESYGIKRNLSNFLLKNLYTNFFWFEHWHHPQPYLRKTLLDVRELYANEMNECSKNKFRANNDLTHYINRYWHLVNNQFFPCFYDDGLEANINSIDHLKKLIQDSEKYNFVCYNDSTQLKYQDFKVVKEMLTDYLESKFPKKASFEFEGYAK